MAAIEIGNFVMSDVEVENTEAESEFIQLLALSLLLAL